MKEQKSGDFELSHIVAQDLRGLTSEKGRKISDAKTGLHHGPEHNKAISDAMKISWSRRRQKAVA